jgi:hypothetical protein
MKYVVRSINREEYYVEASGPVDALNKAIYESEWEEVELTYSDYSVHVLGSVRYFREVR